MQQVDCAPIHLHFLGFVAAPFAGLDGDVRHKHLGASLLAEPDHDAFPYPVCPSCGNQSLVNA